MAVQGLRYQIRPAQVRFRQVKLMCLVVAPAPTNHSQNCSDAGGRWSRVQCWVAVNGGSPDIVKAEDLLRQTGLAADPNMLSLLELRRDSLNSLRERKLVLELSSEAAHNLAVAARLKVPKFVKLSVDYEVVLREKYEHRLTQTIRF